jgi:hypothetical protein
LIADQVHSQRWRLQYSIFEIGYERPFPATLLTPPMDLPLRHDLLRACRPGKIIFSDQQITLLSDPW